AGRPLSQVAITLAALLRGERRTLDRADEAPDVFAVQPDRRIAQPALPARVEVDAPAVDRSERAGRAGRVIPPEVQPLGNVIEGAVQRQLADEGPVGPVVAAVERRPSEHLRLDDAAVVIASGAEE